MNPIERIILMAKSTRTFSPTFDNQAIRNLGFALYTHSDPYLFTAKSRAATPAGTQGLENLKYLWVPRIFKVERPEINDGHLIANEIRDEVGINMKDGRYYSFNNVSLGADLYRRFRWAGVFTGSILFSIMYAIFSRIWYINANISGKMLGVLIAVFPSTFIQGPPIRSVSETAWNWFYELPNTCLCF